MGHCLQVVHFKSWEFRTLLLFFQIKSINSFFEWLNKSAILRLFPEYDEQGEQLHWRERQFIYGGASYRLGPPRLRQLRVKKGSVSFPYYCLEISFLQQVLLVVYSRSSLFVLTFRTVWVSSEFIQKSNGWFRCNSSDLYPLTFSRSKLHL